MTPSFTSFSAFKQRYPIRPNDAGMLLGSGSYGRVIKVEDQVETEWVAIKISEFKGNDTKSLKAEVELAQRVPRQGNIARYDACHRLETDTSVSDFAIMKYYPDGNLADLLRRVTLSPDQIYDITRGILLGLQHLHRHRIVHRDFKPANILISRDNAGRFIPKIADFGLSKLVSDDELDSSDFDLSDGRGTPSYKAPEQIEGNRVSFNLDLWAFGIILFEMMTGEKPFRADLRNSSEQSARREIEKKIVTVDLPARISQIDEPYGSIIRRCLVRDIHERVRKEDELLDLLDRIPTRLADAQTLANRGQYDEALGVYEQVLAKREHHPDAIEGVMQCKAAIEKQGIAHALREAESLLARHQLKQAEQKYEHVLRLDPKNLVAITGLARCIELLQPKMPVAEPELTDVYEEEKTDAYVAPVTPIAQAVSRTPVVKGKVSTKKSTTKVPDVGKPVSAKVFPEPVVIPSTVTAPGRSFPWRVIVPVAAVFGGIMVYLAMNRTPPPVTPPEQTKEQTAAIGPNISSKTGETPVASPVKTDVANTPVTGTEKATAKEALNKRIDIALGKARQAFRQKKYDDVIVLTKSALQLDPTRRDVAALEKSAVDARKKAAMTEPVPVPTAVVETPKTAVVAPESAPAKPTEPDPKDVAAAAKKEAQEKYNRLMGEGLGAITKSNNKAKAKESFSAGRSLAKEYDLNTAKADEAYTYAMNKGQSLFDRNTFDGARDWYVVAQAAKDTKDVQKQIRLCTNQTQ